MDTRTEKLLLNTGAKMPVVGLGTYKSPPEKVGQAVEYALSECGYCHIDCAAIYENEKEIGSSLKAVFDSGTRKREDIFITSKLWNTDHRREAVHKACRKTLDDLNLDYLDLYLIHWGIAMPPAEKKMVTSGRDTATFDKEGFLVTEKVSIRETWEAMQELLQKGLVKAIGVSNFTTVMLLDLLSYATVKPAVNQVELHPYLQQRELLKFCTHEDIVMTAYSPLGSPGNTKGKGLPVLLENETIETIAKDHDKTPAQVLIRWGIQRKTVVIPKSTSPERIKENIGVFDFQLSGSDMEKIEKLDRNLRFFNPYSWWKIPYFN